MSDTIGNITVPDFTDSGETFPIVPDWGYGYAQDPHVVVHQFGSGNAKIEQRFYQGTSAKRFTVRRARLTAPERVALRDFYEDHTPYQSFTYNCPNDNGTGTTAYKVRFAEEPLSFQDLSDYVCSTGVTLIEVPTTSPTYTLNSTVTRFPSASLATALLDQAQEIIPLIKIAPRESGYPAIYVSDRRCTIGTQLYIPRLLDFDGISQGISGESDQASFTFGNADRAMRDLANDTNLLRAGVEFSLFHVGTGIKLDLWKGEVVSWDMNAGPEFRLSCADGIYELTLPYPCRRISRTCWKSYNDAAGCPYATQSTGLDTTHFPTVSVLSCDKSYDGANGCLAHGMKRYFGGIIAEPQTFKTGKILFNPMMTKSLVADSIYESVLPEIYCNNPSYKDENNTTKYGMPVQCKVAAVRDELDFFSGLGIVGEGPITFGNGHTIDGIYHYGEGTSSPTNGLKKRTGTDPAGTTDYFSLYEVGDTTSPLGFTNWRKVYVSAENATYKDNYSAGVACLVLKRNDDEGVQISKVSDHNMEAVVTYGLQGWRWTAAGTRSWGNLSNPVWIVVNMLLKAKGARHATAAVAEAYFDVTAAIAMAAICSTSVSKIIGTGTETQFTYQGTVADERPLRDWITDVLMNCCGYYTWSFGKLKIGIRSNSSAVETFTDGNILFRSLNLSPLRPSFNYLSGQFRDQEYKFSDNNVTVYDEDHAKLVGGSAAPLYLKAQIPLSGTSTKSQAARIVATRLREELGGINTAQWRDARELSFRTTILSLAVEPGIVCSMTHADMPSGAGEFRVTGWRLNKDYSIDIAGRTTVDEMYDMTVGPKPADVEADPVPIETPVVESPFTRVYAGLESDGSLPDGSVTIPKLVVVPDNICPDSAFQDESAWVMQEGWSFLVNDGSNLAHQMGVPKCAQISSTSLTYSYHAYDVPSFAGVGQTLRLRYKAYNNSNQTMYAGVSFKDVAGADISLIYDTLAPGSGHKLVSKQGVVPAGTVKLSFWARNNGTGLSGTMAIGEWKLDVASSTDLLVDDSVTGPKVLDGTLTDDHITITSLSALVSNLGTVTAGTITGTTFRTAADGSGNYIELSGTTIKGKDSGGNDIWNMYPAQGPLSITDGTDANYQVAINATNFGNVGSIAGYDDITGNPNTPEGMAAAIEAAWDYYAATGFTGKWNVTSLLPTSPRYVLVAINAVVSSGSKAELIAGPITPSPEWQAIPGRWMVTFLKDNNAVRVGILGAVTDTRLVIVPVMKIGSGLFIHRNYSGSLTGVSGTLRIVGVFA